MSCSISLLDKGIPWWKLCTPFDCPLSKRVVSSTVQQDLQCIKTVPDEREDTIVLLSDDILSSYLWQLCLSEPACKLCWQCYPLLFLSWVWFFVNYFNIIWPLLHPFYHTMTPCNCQYIALCYREHTKISCFFLCQYWLWWRGWRRINDLKTTSYQTNYLRPRTAKKRTCYKVIMGMIWRKYQIKKKSN